MNKKKKKRFNVSVPSAAPQNVTVHVNESMLLVRWKAPPPNKINGILQGYDVLVDDGKYVSKVSYLQLSKVLENILCHTMAFLNLCSCWTV